MALRAINLRQIETFKAVIERGTVSRAAEAMAMSQPTASKLLTHLEIDTGLRLFDREKGRLVPTAQARRLYEEIDHIFAGVRQVESAVAVVRREALGRLVVGVLPELEGPLVWQATENFLARYPNVCCSIKSTTSKWIAEEVLTRQVDIVLAASRLDNTAMITEPLLGYPLVCIMPNGHPLARHTVITPEDLDGARFIGLSSDGYAGEDIAGLFAKRQISPNKVLSASTGSTVCHFVSVGLGVALLHPLLLVGSDRSVVIRPFEPATPLDFQMCYWRDARNAHLIAAFVQEIKATAALFLKSLAPDWGIRPLACRAD